MTRREAAIVTAFTGVLCGSFDAFHEYAEELLERPVFSHEFGDRQTMLRIQQRAKEAFVQLGVDDQPEAS